MLLDGNYTRMLRAILNKYWRQHSTKQQLYGHLPPIMKIIQVRRTRNEGHCCGSRDELISDIVLWTPSHGQAKVGRPARSYIQQLCANTGCCLEDTLGVMDDGGGQGDLCWWCDMMMMMMMDLSYFCHEQVFSQGQYFFLNRVQLNWEFFFSWTGCYTQSKESSILYYLSIVGVK